MQIDNEVNNLIRHIEIADKCKHEKLRVLIEHHDNDTSTKSLQCVKCGRLFPTTKKIIK